MQHKRGLYLGLVMAMLFFLSSCTTTTKPLADGPPPYDVDVSKIKDPVPKNEPLSKYGNLNTYKVFGKSYHVMKSSKHYEARGEASWYGKKFHHQSTSSGEPYNMLAMTAAHKTLPLPTYVQVTNLTNGKKVIVKVNDRGPFSGNRLIDLSYVAAKKLGMLGRGTAPVDVKAIDPSQFSSHPVLLAKHSPTTMYLQVGAFKNKHYAERLKQKITPMISSPIRIANSKKIYHVKIGPIKDLATAHHISKRLKAAGLSTHLT